jgi:hypothetical protein
MLHIECPVPERLDNGCCQRVCCGFTFKLDDKRLIGTLIEYQKIGGTAEDLRCMNIY